MTNSSEPGGLPYAFAVLLKAPYTTLLDDEIPEDLEAALASLEEFYITDDERNHQVRKMCADLDRRCARDKGFINGLVLRRDEDIPVRSVKRLLSLGINADLESRGGYRPSHVCSLMGNWNMANVLFVCRPDLQAKSSRTGKIPAEIARRKEDKKSAQTNAYTKVAAIWEEGAQGFPTIAQLSCEQEFWAVRNLIRRGIVPDAEKFDKYRGKNALEWALIHGKTGMADELRYLFGEPPEAAPDDAKKTNSAEMKEILAVAVSKLTEENGTLAKKVCSLNGDLGVAKEEVSKLKEKLHQFQDAQRRSEEELASGKETLSAFERKDGETKKEIQSMQEEWTKRQELLQSQIKVLQQQQSGSSSSAVSSSMTSAASSSEPAAKRARL